MAEVAPLSLEAAYRALDPQEVLTPRAAAYTARPVAPLATLATQLRLASREGTHLVSGHIGSGKTTELLRLAADLGPDAKAHFVALDAISPTGDLSSIEIGRALLRAIEPTLDRSPFGPLRGFDSLFVGQDQEDEQRVVKTIRDWAARGTIVLLDGLDKLSLRELEPTLARMLAWNLPLSLVATVPLSYLFTPSFSRREGTFAGVHVVPALPVVRRNMEANTNALAWFENVLVTRGVRELFDGVAVKLLATKTAGIIRDFVRSCREAVLAALVQGRSRVDLEMAETALAEFALRITRPLGGDDLRVLNVVAETGRVVGHSTFLALIDGGQIVEYRNGSNWYAVHPLLRDIVVRFAEELAS